MASTTICRGVKGQWREKRHERADESEDELVNDDGF